MNGTSGSGSAEAAFDLDRFVRAQQGVIDQALAELRHGQKRTHWMWFVFPQLAGLGLSPTAQQYAIRNLEEAQAYLRHPLLGERLRACAQALLALQGRSARQIFGYPDELKLRSSMTLFAAVAQGDPVFAAVLERYYAGVADERTLRLLNLAPWRSSLAMKPRITVITLGVDDLERAVGFYRDGLGWATAGIVGAEFEHGAVAFFDLQPALKLALYPRASLAHDAGVALERPNASECALSHNVASREAVDAVMAQACAAGARLAKPARIVFWGGYAGYFQDPDGHLWEVVWNPKWPLPDE